MSNKPSYPKYLVNRVLTRGMTLFPSRAYVFKSGLITCPVPLDGPVPPHMAVITAYAIIIRPKEGYHGHVVG